jgi:glycyl-tRNA synthetase beta subunit
MIDDFDNFFANNLINDPDLDIRSNRLILLIQARNLFYKIANFDKI